MKKILVPTDFSEKAAYALKVAAHLAKKNNATLYVLHMLELPLHLATAGSSGELPEAIYFMKLAHQKFEKLLQQPYLKGIDVQETVEFHQAFDGIIDSVKKHNIDLIVMGSAGATGLKELFIGSNTEKVVRNADVPVLVIKKDMETLNVENFVFASDFGSEYKATFEKALSFATSFDAKIHLLMVNTPNKFITSHAATERMEKFASKFDIPNCTYNIYNDDTIEHGIMNFSKSIDADLIGISTHGRKGLAHFFNGSLSEDLVNHALRPVITFKT
ncbi:universal stress protein [Sungkyunkwania multivorans]|uniref:Universal stress protein n=1 Tax=Sungkyunkwania multivorans TaxID=1173618 RepID=A0ABW3CWF2_9FLAO